MSRSFTLKAVLRASAVFQAVYWSGSHLFAPEWYLRSIGVSDPATGFVRVALGEIGMLTLALAVGTWLLARDPAGNRPLLSVLLVAGTGSAAMSAFHLAEGTMPAGEWVTVSALVVQTALVAVLYPWRESSQRRAQRRSSTT